MALVDGRDSRNGAGLVIENFVCDMRGNAQARHSYTQVRRKSCRHHVGHSGELV